MSHAVYIIGRDSAADVTLPDDTVSRFHAELIVSQDGMLFYSDRSSSGGSFVFHEGQWRPIRAYEVLPADRLRLGQHELTVADLLQRLPVKQPPPPPPPVAGDGKVRRDPISGEVMRG